jgi:hypothetical protein
MRDSSDDEIDRAYRVAVETTTDEARVQRRRAAVLEAVVGLDAIPEAPVDRPRAAPGDRAAANEPHLHPSATGWRGAAAACVIGASALLVVRMQQAPEAAVEAGLRSDASPVAASARAGVPVAAPVAEAPAGQSGLSTVPAPATVKAASPRAPVAQSGAEAGAADAAPREQAVAALPSISNGTPEALELRKSLTSRPGLPSATSKQAMGEVAVPAPVRADTAVGNAAAKRSPPRDNVSRLNEAAAPAPGSGLLLAVHKGDLEAVRTILQSTEPDVERDPDGRTALAIAVLQRYLPLVKLLLASGANRDVVDRFGRAPVDYARASGDSALLQAFGTP